MLLCSKSPTLIGFSLCCIMWKIKFFNVWPKNILMMVPELHKIKHVFFGIRQRWCGAAPGLLGNSNNNSYVIIVSFFFVKCSKVKVNCSEIIGVKVFFFFFSLVDFNIYFVFF